MTHPDWSPYEQAAWAEIQGWLEPDASLRARLGKWATAPFSAAGAAAFAAPGLGAALQTVTEAAVQAATRLGHATVRPDAVCAAYREAGFPVAAVSHVAELELAAVDGRLAGRAAKYGALALTEGAATGALGLPGLLVDVPTLLVLCLRAIGEHAAYCGFDVSDADEQLFAVQVLAYASCPDSARGPLLAQVDALGRDIVKKKTVKKAHSKLLVKLIRPLAKKAGARLTKAKLAQVIPAVGAAAGAAINAWYMGLVCDAAYHLYRRRFLARKAGPAGAARSDPPPRGRPESSTTGS